MSKSLDIDPRITQFCERLSRLNSGEKARLKRNAGRTLAESRNVFGLFFDQLLPPGVPRGQESEYFLVATLYPLADSGGSGTLGAALRQARDSDSLDRRVEILLDANATQRPFRLRQAVRFLYSKRVPVHWPRLLHDLLCWDDERWHIRETWARDYFVGEKGATSDKSQKQ